MKKTLSIVMTFLIVLSTFSVFPLTRGINGTELAYIYLTETSTANSYRSFLDANGYATTLIPMSDVATTDFSLYDLIIVGSDTGDLGSWGDEASVAAIDNSGKPIVGLGEGGYAFFGRLELDTGWPHGWHGNENRIYVVDPSHTVFNTPNPITIPEDNVIQLYNETGHVGIYLPSIPTNIVAIGREPDDDAHYPLTLENERHLLWGFTASPDIMTQVGRDLFLNVVDYVISLYVILPLYVSLNIEDALEGVIVNKVVGDLAGPADYAYVEIVTKIFSFVQAEVPVVLNIPSDLFGPPIDTWVRDTTGGERISVGYDDLGSGRYRVTTDLSPITVWWFTFYRRQIVWRFQIPNDVSPQDVTLSAHVQIPCVDPSGSGTVRILAPGSVRSLIIANRELLYDNYVEWQVTSLLQRLFTEAQGHPASHTPRGVVYYVDRYDTQARNWDNTAVVYTSEATANVVANAIDDLIEDWHEDATEYVSIWIPFIGIYIHFPISSPDFLLIVGNDDTIPFYRYNDPRNDEAGWGWNSNPPPNANPAVLATDNDYFFTDNPYADLAGGTDWQTGDIELAVGRLLGETAADMLSLLEEGVSWDNGRRGAVVMASLDGWELGLEPDDGRSGEIADLYDVTALFRGKGFQVRNDDIPASEVRTIDVMSPYEGGGTSWNNNFRNAANDAGGMDLFFIGGHQDHNVATLPGDDFTPDDTPSDYTRFGVDHPIVMIVGCHGGTPVLDGGGVNGGADNNMVYDLIHEGVSAYIGGTGYTYGSPGNLHRNTWGERLIQDFFHWLLFPAGGNSMALGAAMARAKSNYVFGIGVNDALDRKTVTEFNVYGVPWTFIFYPSGASGASSLLERRAFTTLSRSVAQVNNEGVYSRTFDVDIESYEVRTETQDDIDYDIFSIAGGDIIVPEDGPILPYIEGYRMTLPFGASVVDVEVVDSISSSIGTYNIPIADVGPFTDHGLRYTTETDIDYPYPRDEDLVQYQETSEGLLFTVLPIQHNPTTDETTFYSHLTIRVTYEAPLTVAVTEFATDKAQFMSGEEISATARIENVGDTDATLTATLTIKDAHGLMIGTWPTPEISVPSGGSYVMIGTWPTPERDGAYTVQIAIESEGAIVGGSSTWISVVGGEIAELTTPVRLGLGEEGTFEVTFANYRDVAVTGQVALAIQDSEGGLVEELTPQTITVAGESTETTTFTWTPIDVSTGNYKAVATVVVDDQTYGPTSRTFEVVTRLIFTLHAIDNLREYIISLYEDGEISEYKYKRIIGDLAITEYYIHKAIDYLDMVRHGFDDKVGGMHALYYAVKRLEYLAWDIQHWVKWYKMPSDLADEIVQQLESINMVMVRKARCEALSEKMLAEAAVEDSEERGKYAPWLHYELSYIERHIAYAEYWLEVGWLYRAVYWFKVAFWRSQRTTTYAYDWHWDISLEDWIDELEGNHLYDS